jgi:hypothetical protein
MPKKITVRYVPVENAIAEWGDKQAVMKRFEGLNINTLNKWLIEMRDNRRFRIYVLNPTHKLVWINFDGFLEFLEWKTKKNGF